jgi:hypothetical protein
MLCCHLQRTEVCFNTQSVGQFPISAVLIRPLRPARPSGTAVRSYPGAAANAEFHKPAEQAMWRCVLHTADTSDHTAIINHVLIDEVACVVRWGEEERGRRQGWTGRGMEFRYSLLSNSRPHSS